MENLLVVGGIMGTLLLLYSIGAYFVARVKHDNSTMDVLYGPAFVVGSGGTLWLTQTYDPLPLIIVGLVTLWASRLAVRIARKNWGTPEDARYAAWRKTWEARGRWYFLLRSYFQINLLQCFIIQIVALPVVLAVAFPTAVNWWFVAAGTLVFCFGLLYETTADWQLDRFIANKKAGRTDETLMKQGLFRFSRRPNYFGESLIWWGLAIIVLPLPYGWITLASPILITYIMTQVTGPMLEAQFLEKYPDAYRQYMATTNYFIPGPPRATHSA